MSSSDTTSTVCLRPARREDMRDVAILFDMSNSGLNQIIWSELCAPGETWVEVGMRQIAPEGHEHVFRTIVVAEIRQGDRTRIAGMIMFYLLPPDGTTFGRITEYGHPFDRLTKQVGDSFYLANMAVYPQFRGYRLATKLLDKAITFGYTLRELVSAIVHESNVKLLAHYDRRGLRQIAAEKVGPHPVFAPDSRWLLLTCRKPDGFLPTQSEERTPDGQ